MVTTIRCKLMEHKANKCPAWSQTAYQGTFTSPSLPRALKGSHSPFEDTSGSWQKTSILNCSCYCYFRFQAEGGAFCSHRLWGNYYSLPLFPLPPAKWQAVPWVNRGTGAGTAGDFTEAPLRVMKRGETSLMHITCGKKDDPTDLSNIFLNMNGKKTLLLLFTRCLSDIQLNAILSIVTGSI